MKRRREVIIQHPQIVLPEGYTPRRFLKSTGTQWINTGVRADSDKKIIIKCSPDDWGWMCVAGEEDYIRSFMLRVTPEDYYSMGHGLYFQYGGSSSVQGLDYPDFKPGETYTIEMASGFFSVTSESGQIFSQKKESDMWKSNYTIYLFDINHKSNSSSCFRGPVYSCQIFNKDTVVRDYCPCLDKNGVPCMFDLINQEPYYNEGSGPFTWG